MPMVPAVRVIEAFLAPRYTPTAVEILNYPERSTIRWPDENSDGRNPD